MMPRRELVVVGAADGGLTALSTILNALPAAFQLPILVALRTHPQSVQTLVRIMNGYSALSGCDGEGMLGLSAVEEAGGVAVLEDPDANALPSLLRRPPDLDRPSHHARLDGIAPLLAMLVDG